MFSSLTQFFVAAVIGNVKDVEMIINSGVNVNMVDKEMKRTPLHYAAAKGNMSKCLFSHAINSMK